MGKTTGAIQATADTGAQITYLCPRREVMGEVGEKVRDAGLNIYTLPAFTRDCATANGEYGDEWAKTVRDWYNRGATPKDILNGDGGSVTSDSSYFREDTANLVEKDSAVVSDNR